MGCPELTIYDYFRFVKADLSPDLSPIALATGEASAKEELELSAIDMNGNSVIDLAGPDRVTKYENGVISRDSVPARRSRTIIFPNDNSQNEVEASVSDISTDGLHSWNSQFGKITSSSTVYNGNGQKTVTVTNPDSSTVTQIYQDGKLISSTHSVLGTTTYGYDSFGRLTSETRTENSVLKTTSYTYDKNDRLVSLVESSTGVPPVSVSRLTEFTYDSMGRRISQTQPGGRTTTYTYSSTGELTGTSGSDTYPVIYTYDSMGRLKTLTDGNGNTTTWNYDSLRGFLSSKTYADGQGTSYTYNPDGALQTRTWARVTQAFQPVVSSYSYNLAGDLTGVTYSDGVTPNLTYTRDRLGRPVSILCAHVSLPLCTSFTYNPDSTLASETIPYVAGDSIAYTYDNLGRRTALNLLSSDSCILTSSTYSYDGMSRLDSVSDGSITANYARIAGTNLLSATNVTNNTNPVLTVNRSYDNLNRLTSISTLSAHVPQCLSAFSYTYNDRDQRAKVTLADGSYWEYTYDDLGQVTSGKKYNSTGTVIPGQDFGYTFDPIGNRTKSSTGVPACEYSYSANALNQYTQRTVPGVIPILGQAAEDATVKIHRIITDEFLEPSRDGKYFSKIIDVDNSANSVEEALDIYCYKMLADKEIVEKRSGSVFLPKSPELYQSDADGNLLSDGRFNYSWDAENRLVGVESSTGVPPVSRIKVEFSYDYRGRRISKKIYSWTGADWQLSKTEKFVYDGNVIIAVFDDSNSLKESYLYGEDISGSLQTTGGIGGLIAVTDSSGTYYPCFDGNGNITAYIDSTGAKSAGYEYSPDSKIIVKSGPKADNFRMRFSTLPYDPETNSTRYLYRDLFHEIGRFSSRDPIGEQTGNGNPYRITSNDTINKYDALGLWGTDIHQVATKRWAKSLQYPEAAADAIGKADEGVDYGDTSPTIEKGQKYHFDRPFGGTDSRLELYEEHLKKAKEQCTWNGNIKNDNPEEAAKQLGTSLHPYQDWVAHADFAKFDSGFITSIHNEHSPQNNLDEKIYGSTRWKWVDDPRLDATYGPNGRPAGNAINGIVFGTVLRDYAIFQPGTQRLKLTKEITDKTLKEFQGHLRTQKECCKCLEYFGIKE